jgi:DNA-binding MarR family transcriptional regulator
MTTKQRTVLEEIYRYMTRYKGRPNLTWLSEQLLISITHVHRQVQALRAMGYLGLTPSITITGKTVRLIGE